MEDKKCCELCGGPARMYCESDQASLCWVCDERVHSANFLVAKHTRRLLCQVCGSPTPWAAAGPKLGPTVSVCDGCFDRHGRDPVVGHQEEEEEYSVNGDGGGGSDEDEEGSVESDDFDDDDDDDDEEEEEEEEEDDEDEEEDGENQVVPWSCESTPPPAASSSSSGEESAAIHGGRQLGLGPKRAWEIAFSNDSDDEIGCASSHGISRAFAAAAEQPSTASFRPTKQQRFGEEHRSLDPKSSSAAIVDSLKRLQKNSISEDDSAATVLGICRLSRC